MLRGSEGDSTLSSWKFMYMEQSKLVCVPIVKCEVLGPQHSLLLTRITWVRCKGFADFLQYSWKHDVGDLQNISLLETCMPQLLTQCWFYVYWHIFHLWASQNFAVTTLGSQVSSHQCTAFQQGRGEKADFDVRCHKISCAWVGVPQMSRLQYTQ